MNDKKTANKNKSSNLFFSYKLNLLSAVTRIILVLNKLIIDQEKLRESWLRKELWSMSELINLCCGSLNGTRPSSDWAKQQYEEYQQRVKEQGSDIVSPPNDFDTHVNNLKHEVQEPATVAEDLIMRGIRSKKLSYIEPGDLTGADILYSDRYYFVPRDAIQWAEAQSNDLPKFPFKATDIDTLPAIPKSNVTTAKQLLKYLKLNQWSYEELRDLCCGLEPDVTRELILIERMRKKRDQGLKNTKEDQELLKNLRDADEGIRRAILADSLEPDVDPSIWKNKIHFVTQRLFFNPGEALAWASTRFEAFPFREEDCPVKEVMQKIETALPEKTPQATWTLKPFDEIQRMPGYRAILRQTLQKMFEEGKPSVPTAYEVLDSWRNEFKKEQPKECQIWVFNKSFEYKNKDGESKTVDIKALTRTIRDLTTSQ